MCTEKMMLPIHRLIPFSNVEGLGNRASIFVQGCNLNCLYCHNSETIPKTSKNSHEIPLEEIVTFIKKSMPFIRGITISGGEPTLYPLPLKELFDQVHILGLSCYIDTNGFFDYEHILPLIKVTDKFLFDIKGDNSGLTSVCFSNKKDSNKLFDESIIFRNLRQLLMLNKIEEVRFVYIKNHFKEEDVITKIASVLHLFENVPLRIIPMHLKGLEKSRAKFIIKDVPTEEEVEKLILFAKNKGIKYVV